MLNPCDPPFAEMLSAKLPSVPVKPTEPRYLEEPRNKYFGQPSFVAAPRNTEDVARVVRLCAEARVGIER